MSKKLKTRNNARFQLMEESDMNSIVNHRSVIVSTVVIGVALLCIALLVGVLLIHDSMSVTHLAKHGVMLIQAPRMVLGILPPCGLD
jgi:hypothetical protein